MKKYVIAGILVLGLLSVGVHNSQAQFGIGAKIPPLILPNFFVSYMLSEKQLVEVSGSLQLLEFGSTISLGALLKQYLDAFALGEYMTRPYLGGGGGLAIGSVSLPLGGTTSFTVITLNLIAGLEHRLESMPLSLFLEIGAGISLSPFGFGMGGGLGARFDF